tara:strand:+ start:1963 stop:2448 length:486 start_codon:yes stop_codon:yes gene_type:complete
MALQELLSYSAQKVTMKALRGNYFQLIINIKTSAGADYDFTNSSTETDNGYFQVLTPAGNPMQNIYASYQGGTITQIDPSVIVFNTTVEDGKLTITSTNDVGFWPAPGIYKYNLFTQLVDSSVNTDQLSHWLYGDFVVVDDNPSTNIGGVPASEQGFYIEG